MRVVAIQLESVWEDKAASHARVGSLLGAAAPESGSLVVLPEMFATGFSMAVERIAEGADGPSHRLLAECAVRHGVWVLGGVVTRHADGRGLNQAVLVAPDGREAVRYSKLHPFSFAGENRHYAPGAEVVVTSCGEARLAPLICYDLRFPEAFRIAARHGATVYAVIANWPSARLDHWLALLAARAIENQAYVVGVNRCGRDPHAEYPGRSLVVDPRGRVVADAGTGEGVLAAELDLAALAAYRREFPALADLRRELVPEATGGKEAS